MSTIQISLPGEYRETLDFLKEVIAWADGAKVKDDNELVETLVAGFMAMIQEQSHHHHHGENCNHEH